MSATEQPFVHLRVHSAYSLLEGALTIPHLVTLAAEQRMPIVAVVDSNSDPDGISHPIPGNDDAGRAITLYCDMIARAAIDGIERAQGSAGVDLGAADAPPTEPGLEGDEAGEGTESPPTDGERRPQRRRPGRPDARAGNGKGPSQARRPARAPRPSAEAKPE